MSRVGTLLAEVVSGVWSFLRGRSDTLSERPLAAPIEKGHRSAILCHLGNITARLNRSVQFDPVKQTIVGDPEAEAFMSRPYRKPWSLGSYA